MNTTGPLELELELELELRTKMIEIARTNKIITLASNKEYWERLEYQPGTGFVNYGGDPVAAQEEFRKSVTEDEAVVMPRKHFASAAGTQGQSATNPEDILAWLRKIYAPNV